MGNSDRSCSQRSSIEATSREWLLDELDPEPDQLRDEFDRLLGDPAGVGVDPDGSAIHAADGLERLEVAWSSQFDLEGRKRRRPSRPPRDDSWLVDPDREVGRRDVGRQAEDRVDRRPEHFPNEVVERDVDGAARAAVTADGTLHAEVSRGQPIRVRREFTDSREQVSEDRRHRGGRLAVEAVRVPFPEPHDPVEPVVTQLDDDRCDEAVVGVVIRSGDPERVAQPQPQDLVGQVDGHPRLTHGSASTASRIAGHSRSGPNRNGSSVDNPVCSPISATSRRASASSG